MEVQPAHISQVMDSGGGWVEVDADAGMVADDLRRIDPTLHVRFQPNAAEPFFAVFCQPSERETYLVLTVKAYQGATGAWMGLDQRVVREIERVGADNYDYAGEVDRMNRAAAKAKEDGVRERLEQAGSAGFELLHRLRGRNCGHMSVGSLPPKM